MHAKQQASEAIGGTTEDLLAEEFESQRPRLRAVAYRMLGSVTEADDAVQEAWLRLTRADAAGIASLPAWLTTVVSRVCLDLLRSRTARREDSLEVRFPDPVVSDDETDPEQQAFLADSVGLAMLVVLDELAPAERLSFVLHDLFGLAFAEIAPIVVYLAGDESAFCTGTVMSVDGGFAL